MAGDTRLVLRNLVRDKLMAWPDACALDGAINSSVTSATVTVNPNSRIQQRSLLEIDSELLEVTDVASLVLTVLRGVRGTTAASPLTAAAVKVYSWWAWTDAELNDCIDSAVDFLSPMAWKPAYKQASFTQGYKEFALPDGVENPNGNDILEVCWLGDDGLTWTPLYSWFQHGGIIRMSAPMPETRTMRLTVRTRQPRLAADTDALDYREYRDPVVFYATKIALENLLANRIRYIEYSASLEDRASTPDEIQRTIFYFANQAIVARERIGRPVFPTLAKTYRGT